MTSLCSKLLMYHVAIPGERKRIKKNKYRDWIMILVILFISISTITDHDTVSLNITVMKTTDKKLLQQITRAIS